MRSQKNVLKGNSRRLHSQSLGVPRCGRGSEDSQVSDLEACVDDGSVVHEGREHRRGRYGGKDQEFGEKMRRLSQTERNEYQISERIRCGP